MVLTEHTSRYDYTIHTYGEYNNIYMGTRNLYMLSYASNGPYCPLPSGISKQVNQGW